MLKYYDILYLYLLSKKILVSISITKTKHLPRHKTGVFVSLKPRKTPWRAKDTTTAGAPKALSERNRCAGIRMDEP